MILTKNKTPVTNTIWPKVCERWSIKTLCACWTSCSGFSPLLYCCNSLQASGKPFQYSLELSRLNGQIPTAMRAMRVLVIPWVFCRVWVRDLCRPLMSCMSSPLCCHLFIVGSNRFTQSKEIIKLPQTTQSTQLGATNVLENKAIEKHAIVYKICKVCSLESYVFLVAWLLQNFKNTHKIEK